MNCVLHNSSSMIKKSIVRYIFLLISCVLIPFITCIIIILITGDRISGLKYFVIPSILLIHFIFAQKNLELNFVKKVVVSFISSILMIGLTFGLISTGIRFDFFGYNGFWEIILFIAISSITTRELIYQINKGIFKISKQ